MMADDYKKFPLKTNEKYFIQKEVIPSKYSNPKSTSPFVKSDQKHQKTISFHKFPNSYLHKDLESNEESLNKSANKSAIGLHLTNHQFNQIINERKKAFNEKMPKTARQETAQQLAKEQNFSNDKSFFCKKCKENEEFSKKIMGCLNNMAYEMSSFNEIELLWRNGNFSFENERIGIF